MRLLASAHTAEGVATESSRELRTRTARSRKGAANLPWSALVCTVRSSFAALCGTPVDGQLLQAAQFRQQLRRVGTSRCGRALQVGDECGKSGGRLRSSEFLQDGGCGSAERLRHTAPSRAPPQHLKQSGGFGGDRAAPQAVIKRVQAAPELAPLRPGDGWVHLEELDEVDQAVRLSHVLEDRLRGLGSAGIQGAAGHQAGHAGLERDGGRSAPRPVLQSAEPSQFDNQRSGAGWVRFCGVEPHDEVPKLLAGTAAADSRPGPGRFLAAGGGRAGSVRRCRRGGRAGRLDRDRLRGVLVQCQ
jgi:hypothetical protein